MAAIRGRRTSRLALALTAALALSACATSVLNDAINEPISNVAEQGGWPPWPGSVRLHRGRRRVLGRRHAGLGLLLWRSDRTRPLRNPDRPRPSPHDRNGRSDLRGLRRFGDGRVFRPQGSRRLAGLPDPVSRPRCRAGFRHRREPGQCRPDLPGRGANDRSKFPKWLDDNVFDGATYASLFARKRPLVWISASDIYSRVPFVFEPGPSTCFAAISGRSSSRRRLPPRPPFRACSFP